MHKVGGSPGARRCPARHQTRAGGGEEAEELDVISSRKVAKIPRVSLLRATRPARASSSETGFCFSFLLLLPSLFSVASPRLSPALLWRACRLYVSVSARQSTRSACSIGDDERIARARVCVCVYARGGTRWWTRGGGDALARGRPCLDNAITSLNFLSRRLTSVTGGTRPGKLDSRNNKIYFSARALWYARPCAPLSLSLSPLSCTVMCQRTADMRRITRRNVRGRAYAPGLCMPRLYTDHAQRRA